MALQRLGLLLTSDPPFGIRNVANHGQGFFARGHIPRGALILEEEALFSINNVSDPMTAQNIIDIQNAAQQHPSFNQLFCPIQLQHLPERRFEVNNFEMGASNQQGNYTQGVFFKATRINHSCVPNAYFAWNSVLNRLTVYAIMNISHNSEIFVNYRRNDAYENVQVRRLNLQTTYHFNCNCDACHGTRTFGQASRQRRTEMRTLKNRIDSHQPPTSWRQRLRQLEDFQELREKLRIEGLVFPQLAWALGQEAERYADELNRPSLSSVFSHGSCRAKALEAVREMLLYTTMSEGINSDDVIRVLGAVMQLQ